MVVAFGVDIVLAFVLTTGSVSLFKVADKRVGSKIFAIKMVVLKQLGTTSENQ